MMLTFRRFLCAAGHSRERLKTTRDMLTLAFTYLQVMPEFLDFLFLFGKQAQAEDLYCSGFRQRTRLIGPERGLVVTERNWSGCDLQVCYSLKSVERSGAYLRWPWSIRHCAVQHGFDAEQIRSTWIIIKGDDSMERRIKSATSNSLARPRGPIDVAPFDTIDRAFAASLATHLIMCDWSTENWRWYIKFLEERFEELTEEATSTNADVPVSPMKASDGFMSIPRSDTEATSRTNKSRISVLAKPFNRTKTNDSIAMSEAKKGPSLRLYTNASGNTQPLPPGKTLDIPQVPSSPPDKSDIYGQQIFSFKDLQDIHHIEEKANESMLVLKLNLNVISQLQEYYKSIMESHELSEIIREKCKGDMMRFKRRIDAIVRDVELQVLRVEALLHLLADRKTLVS